jgi:hypothetical protein
MVRMAGELTGLDMTPLSADMFGRGEAFRGVEALYELVIALGNFVDRLAV